MVSSCFKVIKGAFGTFQILFSRQLSILFKAFKRLLNSLSLSGDILMFGNVLKYFDIFTGSPCGSGESFVCHLDVVARIAGIQVRFWKDLIYCSWCLVPPPILDVSDQAFGQNIKYSIWTQLHQLKSEFGFPTKDFEDGVYCRNIFCIKDPRTASHADQLHLALTFAELKEIVVNFELPARARQGKESG